VSAAGTVSADAVPAGAVDAVFGDAATPLFDALVAFLRDDCWPVSVELQAPELEAPRVVTRFGGTTQEWDCAGRTFERQGQVVFDSLLPLTVAQPTRPDLAVLLVRVNWDILTGAFALSPSTGGIRFRTSLLLPDGAPLVRAAVKGLVYANVLTVDRCLGAIAAAAAGEISVAEALELIDL